MLVIGWSISGVACCSLKEEMKEDPKVMELRRTYVGAVVGLMLYYGFLIIEFMRERSVAKEGNEEGWGKKM